MKTFICAASLGLSVLAVACATEFSTDDTGTSDATDTPTDTGHDTAVDTEPDLPPPCDRNGFETFYDSAEGSVEEMIHYISDSDDAGGGDPFDILWIQLFYGGGDPPPLGAPGTYELASTPAERNYRTCGTCVTVWAGCDPTGVCEKTFFQVGGELELTSVGGTGTLFAGALWGVHLAEVTIDPESYESTPVPDGEGWCIEAFHFESVLIPLP